MKKKNHQKKTERQLIPFPCIISVFAMFEVTGMNTLGGSAR